MQMCANRKHCSSAWLSISVTPLCSGLSLVPLREMFPFKCYLSVSFKTSSFLFWQTARRNGRNRLIEQAFQGRGEMGRERCSAGASLTHPCLCLTSSLLSRGWVILQREVQCALSWYSPFLWESTGALPPSAQFSVLWFHLCLCCNIYPTCSVSQSNIFLVMA